MAEGAAAGKFRAGRATAVVAVAVMCSRLLGLVREVAFSALFGTKLLDYFNSAFRIPNLLRDLFAEGALSTAFITVFTKKITKEGDESAWRLAHKIATMTLVVMGTLTALGMIFSTSLVGFVAGGFKGDEVALTAELTMIMFPFILMVSVAAQVMGMLNAKHVFGWPAMASAFFNIGSIAGGLAIAWILDRGFGPRALYGLAYGTLIGGFLQLAVQFPALVKAGYRPRLDFSWKDSGVKDVLTIMGPAVIAASAVQVNVLVNTDFASHLERGSVTWLGNAFRLMQLPLGIFGVAVGTITLPLLSRAAANNDHDEFRKSLAAGLRLVLFLTVPAAAGLWMLSEPVMSLIYERGMVTHYDIAQSAAALRWYAIGLAAYAAIKVLAPAFYAIDRRKTPMMVSLGSIALNYGLNSWFMHLGWGHEGLAMSTGCVAMTNFALLYWFMRKEIASLETKRLLVTLAKVFLATDALILTCLGCQWLFLSRWQGMGFLLRAVCLLTTIALAMGAFAFVARWLRLREMSDVLAAVARKLGRRKVGARPPA